MDKLKPCPCCGQQAIRVGKYIFCGVTLGCGLSIQRNGSYRENKKAWNKRTSEGGGMKDKQIITINHDKETGMFVAKCKLPTLYSQGTTRTEAFDAIKSAIKLFVRQLFKEQPNGE